MNDRRAWLVVVTLIVSLAGCSGSSHRVAVDPRIVAGRSVALDACRRWDAVIDKALAPNREAAALSDVIRVANDATTKNLIYVQLRSHLELVARADEAGEGTGGLTAKKTVTADCTRIRAGKAPTGLVGG